MNADQTCHEIDITNYIAPEPDDKTERLLYMSVCIDPSNPFDEDMIDKFLSRLPQPLSTYPGYSYYDESLPKFCVGTFQDIGLFSWLKLYKFTVSFLTTYLLVKNCIYFLVN